MARKNVNQELLKRAKEAAQAEIARGARETELEKIAVIPGGDPAAAGAAPPMDPSMMGGAPPMDPAAAGGAPPADPAAGGAPPMDPSMMGGAPASDPMLAGAGGGMADMINQAVQQALAAAGVVGKGGAGGKGGKPDIALELQKLNETIYKYGLILTAMANAQNVELPAAALLGPPPDQADPALAQAATAMPAPATGVGDPAAQGGDPAAQGGIPPLSGDPTDPGVKAASLDMEKLAHATQGLDRLLGYGATGAEVEDAEARDAYDFYDLINGFSQPTKQAAASARVAPSSIGSAYDNLFSEDVGAPEYRTAPMSLARKIRAKVKA